MARSFYFIRHGQSQANADDVPAGRMDSPLTAQGRDEARQVAKLVAKLDPMPTHIHTSKLSRAMDTADIVNEAHGLPVERHALLNEQYYGDFEGKPKPEIRATHGESWYEDPLNGEHFSDFRKRVAEGLKKCFETSHEGTGLVVAHGGVASAHSRNCGYDLNRVKNCCLYFFEAAVDGDKVDWTIYECVENEDGGLRRVPVEKSGPAP